MLLICTGILSAQIPDSIIADSAKDFTQIFLMEELTVSTSQKVTAVGGVGVLEIAVDSISGLPAPTLEQALRKSPLVRVRRNSRGEAQPNLRGGRDRQIAILMDGIPLTLGWDHRTDLSIIPLTSAETVRISRGLSSVLHGPNVLAGAIEIDVSRGSVGERSAKPATVGLGMDHVGSTVVSGSAERSVEIGNEGLLFLKVGAGARSTPGSSVPDFGYPLTRPEMLYGDGNLRLNSDSEHFDGFLSAKYSTDGGQWVSLMQSGSKLNRGVAPEIHENDPRLWRYKDQIRHVQILSFGTGRRQTHWGAGEFEVSAGLDKGHFEIDQFRTVRYDQRIGKEKGVGETWTFRSHGKHTMGAKAEYRLGLTYAEIGHSEGIMKNPGVSLTALSEKSSFYRLNDYQQRIWSFGNEVERTFDSFMGWNSSGTTLVSLGLALDGANTPKTGDKPALKQLEDWGGRLGFSTYLPGISLRLHGGLSRRARFPSLRELYSDALGRFLANPNLKTEVLTGSELGFTWSRPSLNLQTVGFYQILHDAIVRINVDTFGGKKRQRVNKDMIKSSGIEIVAIGSLNGIEYSGDLTWQSVWQHGNGIATRPEYEPNVFGRVSLSSELFSQFFLEGEYRYKGAQYCLDLRERGMQRLRPTSDVGFKLKRLFRLNNGKRLNNLDSSIAVSNFGNSLIFDQCGLPQPGRTVELQLRLF